MHFRAVSCLVFSSRLFPLAQSEALYYCSADELLVALYEWPIIICNLFSHLEALIRETTRSNPWNDLLLENFIQWRWVWSNINSLTVLHCSSLPSTRFHLILFNEIKRIIFPRYVHAHFSFTKHVVCLKLLAKKKAALKKSVGASEMASWWRKRNQNVSFSISQR